MRSRSVTNNNNKQHFEGKSKVKNDLLILTLLKVPVTVIMHISKSLSMLTYTANYFLIRVLDSIIFSRTLCSTLQIYALSWLLRLLSLILVAVIFCSQFYWMYTFLNISHFHWAMQFIISMIAFNAALALMRHGYLTMIKKYSPTKLKSPKQHLLQLCNFLSDVLGIILAIINVLLIANATETLHYEYDINTSNGYLKHIAKLIHKSILDITKLFYISIFFRLFPWRYRHSLTDIEKESNNALPLIVLLTLLFVTTLIDLVFFAFFGIYCAYIHPRKRMYRTKIALTHKKFQYTAMFVFNTILQMLECIILILVLPLKYKQAIRVLSLIIAKENDYSVYYWSETIFVLWLAILTVPSLLCQFILLLSVYKFRKINYLISEQQKEFHQTISPNKQQQYRYVVKEYIVFRCFVSLLIEIPFLIVASICTILKLWNVTWLKFVVDTHYNVRISYVMSYFIKIIKDYLCAIPCLLLIVILGLYDPIKDKNIIILYFHQRRQLIQKIPPNNKPICNNELHFYNSSSAVLSKILVRNVQQVTKDIFLLPLFILERLTFISLMDCEHPADSVELFEAIWLLYYESRVRKSAYGQQYVQLLKKDQSAQIVVNQRQRLRFWKFANKSVRLRMISTVISFLLPNKRKQMAIAAAKVEYKYSAISNHYWHQYNKTISLLKCFCYFVVEIVVSLISLFTLVPLTLWRMPTFIVLLKANKWNTKYFFPILLLLYKQLLTDIKYALMRVFILCLFPKVCLSFYFKTVLRYTTDGIKEFNNIQKAKMWYLTEKVLKDGFVLYSLLLKMLIVKLLWVRNKNMNQKLSENNIKVIHCATNFLMTPQKSPNITQLKQLYNIEVNNIFTMDESNGQEIGSEHENSQQLQKATEQLHKLRKIVEPYFEQAVNDIPYLLLMLFLLFTLPWRAFYIRNALFLMRNDETKRNQFITLLRMVSKDYKCILLYIILLFSIVKTRRAVQLFYRNFKLNFYVGTLKYSHLKQLKAELRQTLRFYYSTLIMIVSCLLGPYRLWQVYSSVVALYKMYRDEQHSSYSNRLMYENTLKEGKSLQLLTVIGQNTLLRVLSFLDVKELTVLTGVCRYTYDIIKEKDEIWKQHWEKAYSLKYANFILNNDFGSPNYNAMCIKKFQLEHFGYADGERNRYYNESTRQLMISAIQTHLDLKHQLKMRVSERGFVKLFTCLRYDHLDGYGPMENWPQADDNEEYLTLMNIQRREIVELSEIDAFFSWFFYQPIEWLIRKFSHFYGNDVHRRKKQLLYVVTNFTVALVLFLLIIFGWSWFWIFDIFFGYKFLGTVYTFCFCVMFYQRYVRQSAHWISLHPFNLVSDVQYFFIVSKQRIKLSMITLTHFMMRKVKHFIIIPMKLVVRKIKNLLRWTAFRVKRISQMFVEKVAKPLYLSISDKLRVLWTLTKSIVRTFIRAFSMFCSLLWSSIRITFVVFSDIFKSISKLYSQLLKYSLKFSLKYGIVGQLIFTIVGISVMISPSLVCYFFYAERWFIMLSTLMTMVLIVIGYKHLNRVKSEVLQQIE